MKGKTWDEEISNAKKSKKELHWSEIKRVLFFYGLLLLYLNLETSHIVTFLTLGLDKDSLTFMPNFEQQTQTNMLSEDIVSMVC